MPNRNGQGPESAGSMTGRRRGLCNQQSQISAADQPAISHKADVDGCRGPRKCGNGQGRRNGCGANRRQN